SAKAAEQAADGAGCASCPPRKHSVPGVVLSRICLSRLATLSSAIHVGKWIEFREMLRSVAQGAPVVGGRNWIREGEGQCICIVRTAESPLLHVFLFLKLNCIAAFA